MKKLWYLVVLIVFIGVAAVAYWNYALSPVNISDKSQKTFVIAKGEAGRSIADHLEKEGLIRSAFVFGILLRQQGGGNAIQAGDYTLSPSLSAQKILDALHHGLLDVWITLPDGARAEEYADLFKKSLKNYDDSWLATLKEDEGYLYPDSYLFPKDSSINTVVSIVTKTFYEKVASLGFDKTSPGLNRTVILASLLEREGRSLDDKKMIASVINNRLAAGMPLQIDASVQYAVGYDPTEKSWWKQGLTVDDLAINSPFNLYKFAGLPPHPICSPGINALTAAAQPANTPYLFYLSDKNGTLHFAKTLAEHNKNVAKYISH
jgi:UPF0755 protein